GKLAKFDHLLQAIEDDKTRRCQMLNKIRECYLHIDRYPSIKTKVSVAAKTLSNTMAAAIETAMSCNKIPSEATHTAEFVILINNLFDSFNSHKKPGPRTTLLNLGISNKTRHISFWNQIIKVIEEWTFRDRKDGWIKKYMLFKYGWINNIKGLKVIRQICQNAGFEYLRTRALNQDPIEKLFSLIRQHGVGNTNPTPFQHLSALKTSVPNNLISHSNKNSNC
ncbi:hypothetical protein ILUMI_20063, partial [Ignelater luminosus]